MCDPIFAPAKLTINPLAIQGKSATSDKKSACLQSLCVADLVSIQAAKTPEAIAVSAGRRVLTYRDLELRARELAQSLRLLGVQPEVLVGLCLPRSVAMIIAALAVLKAGGAYLPIDPDYPQSRISFILNEAGVDLLLSRQGLTRDLPSGLWRVLELDDDGHTANTQPNWHNGSALALETQFSDLAYVIYTSGSTGQPKGVEITQASLLNLIAWHKEAFAVTSRDRASQLASPGFDAAVWEIWPYLTTGASLYLPDDHTRTTSEKLRDWLVEQEITISFVSTPIAEQLVSLDWPSNTSLRFLLTGADRLQHYPPKDRPFVLVNNYGPTECTVVATSAVVSADYQPDSVPPIGRPIRNTDVYILDQNLHPVPVGSAGEIYIGGTGVARGYRNRSDLTEERFIPDPFHTEQNSRLYRTGDMARYLSDGQIAFLGRVDDQIKIRGYRIEPNEIVNVLNRHPGIHSSVVTTRENGKCDKQLLAYFVRKPDAQIADADLRTHISVQLPPYMVPAFFVELRSLPISSNGKIDRNALPIPSDSNVLRDESYIPPRTPIEEKVAEILTSLLRVEKVGMNDNFFFLGGDSLLAAKVAARVHNAFGVELTMLSLFDHPTIGDLSSEIENLLFTKVDAVSEEQVKHLAPGLNEGECA